MSKEISIAAIMVKDHEKISSLLENLESEIEEGSENIRSAFNKFKWELERHFVVEEKAILVEIKTNDGSYKLSRALVNEHRIIWDIVTNTQAGIDAGTRDVSQLKKMLLKHKNMEDRTLYPLLDNTFSDEQKESIKNRIENPI